MQLSDSIINRCSEPETLTKAELLEWAKYNFQVWGNSNENESAWYILLMWAERDS